MTKSAGFAVGQKTPGHYGNSDNLDRANLL
jgi:hypothetical protein